MTRMAELEIDDVAFLAGDGRGLHSNCETCQCLCPRRRFSSSAHGSRGISSLIAALCPNGLSRPMLVTLASALSLFILLLTALVLSLTNSLSKSCSDIHADAVTNDGRFDFSHSLATNGEVFPWPDIRLPPNVHPVHYELFLHPNLTTFAMTGSVEILLTVDRETNFFVVHSKDLNVSEVTVFTVTGKPIEVKKFLLSKNQEQLYIELTNPIMPSVRNYTLKVTFERILEEKLEGFYISSYNDSSFDRKRFLATTHFQPTAARTAFPCFDEPSLKASFSLKMVHEPQHEVFFNSERQTVDAYSADGLKISVFEDTLQMSTYLVAFTVCDFKTLSGRTNEGVHVRVLLPSDQANQGDFALQTAIHILDFYEDFFNISYPLSKLDLMAVPDFAAGAMENWGLITFRTTMILYRDDESSSEFQENVAVVISHELAHQWFGNLVTMEWWNDLWLNEGFSSFLEVLGVDAIHPEFRMLDQFIITTTQDAMILDSLEASHPIMAQVKNPNEIEAIFDVISYKKGAALIRMLENFLKLDVLRTGLTKYLHKYQFRNAKTTDLWQSFTEVVPNSPVNVSAIMDRWVKQKGFPVISSKLERNRLFLSQRRFLSAPVDPSFGDDSGQSINSNNDIILMEDPHPASPFGYQWIVPITIITSKAKDSPRLVWLSQPDAVLTMDSTCEWFKLNVNQSGFYRVNYDDTNWRSLIEVLHSKDFSAHILSPSDRSNLLDDALSFMKVSQLSADLAMNLTSYLEHGERDFVPWETALKQFSGLDAIMNGHPLFRKYMIRILQPTLTVMGWTDGGPHLQRRLRSSLLKSAVQYGDESTIKIAKRFFDEWIMNRYRVSPNFREVVYSTGVRFGSSKDWDFVWKKYKTSKIPSEQRLLLDALSSTRNPWLLSRLLNFSLDRDKIKPQDTVQVITDVARNPDGRLLAWRFVRENWSKILAMFGEGSFSMDLVISGVTYHFSKQFDYEEVSSFFSRVSVGSGSEAVKQSLERIRGNIYWKKYVEDQVVNWLQRQNSQRSNYRYPSNSD